MKPTATIVLILCCGHLAVAVERWSLNDVAPYIESDAVKVTRFNIADDATMVAAPLVGIIYGGEEGPIGPIETGLQRVQAAHISELAIVTPRGGMAESYLLVPTGRNDRQLALAREFLGMVDKTARAENLVGFPLNDVLFVGPKSVFERVRRAEATTRNKKHLRQIALGIVNFESATGVLPPAASYQDKKPLLSWRVHVLPYFGEEAYLLHQKFDFNEPWDGEHNRKLILQMPDVYRHPSADVDDGKTVYLAPYGPQSIFGRGESGTRIRQVLDGVSKTMSVVEAAPEFAVVWTKPSDWEFDLGQPLQGMLGNRNEFSFSGIDARIHTMTKQQAAAELGSWLTKAAADD